MINWVNECGRVFKKYIIYVTEFRFLKEILAAAVLSNIPFSKCVLTFQYSQLRNTQELKLENMFILVQQMYYARGRAVCVGTQISVSETQIILIIRKDLREMKKRELYQNGKQKVKYV